MSSPALVCGACRFPSNQCTCSTLPVELLGRFKPACACGRKLSAPSSFPTHFPPPPETCSRCGHGTVTIPTTAGEVSGMCGGCGLPPSECDCKPVTAHGHQDADGALHRCTDAGCDFSTDDVGAMAVHDATAHGLQEVTTVPRLLAALPEPTFCGHCGIAGPDLTLGALGWARVTLTAPGSNPSEGFHAVLFVALHRSPLCDTEAGAREALKKLAVGTAAGSFSLTVALPTMERPVKVAHE